MSPNNQVCHTDPLGVPTSKKWPPFFPVFPFFPLFNVPLPV